MPSSTFFLSIRFFSFPSCLPLPHLSAYYWVLNLMFLISPRLAYNFSELIESHAVDTYSQFLDENEDLLRRLPAPRVGKREGGREGERERVRAFIASLGYA